MNNAIMASAIAEGEHGFFNDTQLKLLRMRGRLATISTEVARSSNQAVNY
jgi:hypothetical protein